MKFAKIFESEKYGQLVVMKELNDDQDSSIAVHFYPGVEGVDLCAIRYAYDEEAQRDAMFEQVDLTMAEKSVKRIWDMVHEAANNDE